MNHTYLLNEGLWQGDGSFIEKDGSIVKAFFETSIKHSFGSWKNEGIIELTNKNKTKIKSSIDILPFTTRSQFTSWKAINEMFGKLEGRLCIVEDYIMSSFLSIDQKYSGIEAFRCIKSAQYEVRGAIFAQNLRIAGYWFTIKNK